MKRHVTSQINMDKGNVFYRIKINGCDDACLAAIRKGEYWNMVFRGEQTKDIPTGIEMRLEGSNEEVLARLKAHVDYLIEDNF